MSLHSPPAHERVLTLTGHVGESRLGGPGVGGVGRGGGVAARGQGQGYACN